MNERSGDDDGSALARPWKLALAQAWAAHAAGNIGVGAVLTDDDGAVVALGRNRIVDAEAPPGRLRSTFIAHAEMDVLAQLPPGDYPGHTVWTTLEPCLLCSSAIVMSGVGNVRYAARDWLWDGITRLVDVNEFVARRWPVRTGPLDSPVAVFCELLPVLWFVARKPEGAVVRRYADRHPTLLRLAERLARDGRLASLIEQPVDTALAALWDDLSEVHVAANS